MTVQSNQAVLTVTERGLALIVGFIGALFTLAGVVVVVNFFMISNEPIDADSAQVAAVSVIR